MTRSSPTDLLVLHAVRLAGFADTDAVAARFGLDRADTGEHLLDGQASGWVTRSAFAGQAGWSVTDRGRRHNEAQLRAELDEAGARDAVAAVHMAFEPLNASATGTFTAWQLAAAPPAGAEARHRLGAIATGLGELERQLTGHLTRFAGYHARFTGALARAAADPAWLTGLEVDSCHRIWFELHEDLLATLGIPR